MIGRNLRWNGLLTLICLSRSYTTIFSRPGITSFALAGVRSKISTTLVNNLTSQLRLPKHAVEMNEVGFWNWRNWEKWRDRGLVQLHISIFQFLFVGTQFSTNGIGTGCTSCGNPVIWTWSCRVHWKVTLDGIDQLWNLWDHTRVFAGCLFCSTCTKQPRSSAIKEGDNVMALSGGYGYGCLAVMCIVQCRVTTNLIWTSRRRLRAPPKTEPLTSILDLTHARVQLYTIYHILILRSTGIYTLIYML